MSGLEGTGTPDRPNGKVGLVSGAIQGTGRELTTDTRHLGG